MVLWQIPNKIPVYKKYSGLSQNKISVLFSVRRHVAPPIDAALFHATIVPNNGFHRTHLQRDIFFTEACTMKPSGRTNVNCQAKCFPAGNSYILFPALSLTDIRGHDKNDLKNIYFLLNAIEGRVRRLKHNLAS